MVLLLLLFVVVLLLVLLLMCHGWVGLGFGDRSWAGVYEVPKG